MCKKLISLTPLIIVLGLVGNVTVVRATDWTNAAGDGSWHTAGNWSSGLPNAGENAIIDSAAPLTWPTLDGGTADCSQLRIGYTANYQGELTVTGGATLNVNGELRIARKSNDGTGQAVGILYISGDTTTINVTQRIEHGRHGDATIVMSGGYLHSDAELSLAYQDDASSKVYLSGGTIDLAGDPGITVREGFALIDISGDGTLTLAGNQVSSINTFINEGIIYDYCITYGYFARLPMIRSDSQALKTNPRRDPDTAPP